MPRLNSRGQTANGLGGGTVSIDTLPITSPAGGASWLTDDVIIYQVCRDGRCWLETFDQRNGEVREVGGGANNIAAGGGVWAAWRAGYGLFTSHGDRHPEAGPAEVGPDGALAYKPVHQSFGPVILSPSNGPERVLVQTAPLTLQLLGGDRAIWGNADFSVGTSGIPSPRTLPTAAGLWRPRAALVNGEWWIAYVHGGAGGLVLHPFTSTAGYMVHRGSNAFGHDLMAFEGGILVVYSWNEGEQPGELRRELIDLSDPRVEQLASPIVIPDPPDTPTDPKPEPSMSAADEIVPIINAVQADPTFAVRLMENTAATTARSIAFLWQVVKRAHAQGFTRWGLLFKPGRGLVPDVLTRKMEDGRIWHYDVISGGDGINNDGSHTYQPRVQFGEIGEVQPGWIQAMPSGDIPPDPTEPPDPAKPHIYDGGENDTGECDKCGRPRADAIHIQAEPDPIPGDNAMARIEAKLDRLSRHLGV